MKISDLQARVIAIYAGRFHPFHHGHASAYKELSTKFGINNTYIASSGKVEPEKSPFSFSEKKLMMQASGVNPGNVIEERSPYNPTALPNALGLDPNTDVMVFGVGSKDMAEDPRFQFTPLKSGQASYFQKYTGGNMKPYTNDKGEGTERPGHGYIYPVKDYKFTVAGKTAGSASEIRNMFAGASSEEQEQIIKDLYPNADDGTIQKILAIFSRRLG